MEDEIAVHEPLLYAVYDGHGGGEASAIAYHNTLPLRRTLTLTLTLTRTP